MEKTRLREIEEYFSTLNPSEQKAFVDSFSSKLQQCQGLFRRALEDKHEHEIIVCPHCGSVHIRKHGSAHGRRRYYCKECLMTFSDTTGTVLCNIHKPEEFMKYIGLVFGRKTLKECEAELGIAHQTSFDWRHKILSALVNRIPDKMGGVVECDEMEFRESEKGSRRLSGRMPRKRGADFRRNDGRYSSNVKQVITAVSRTGGKVMVPVDGKKVTTGQIEDSIGDKVEDGCVFITDKNAAYCKFSKDHNLQHKTVLAGDHVDWKDRRIHIQHVNSAHSQLRSFIRRHIGISSRYLENYLAWFSYINDYEKEADKTGALARDILCSPLPYAHYQKLKFATHN